MSPSPRAEGGRRAEPGRTGNYRRAGADLGFTCAENRRYPRKGGNHYIIGERLRSSSPGADAALSRQGRYQEVAASLRVKEVRIAKAGGHDELMAGGGRYAELCRIQAAGYQ